jgi:exodeoxyribonuclease V alpha subunit
VILDVTTPPAVAALQPWVDGVVLGPAEVHAAAIVADLLGPADGRDATVLALALALWAPQHGHACIDVDTVADVVAEERAFTADSSDADGAAAAPLPWPQPEEWLAALRASDAVREVPPGLGGAQETLGGAQEARVDELAVLDDRPLVLHGRLVYTQRQWADECAVAVATRRRAGITVPATARHDIVERLLGADDVAQRAAASTAATSALTIVAGGPGTGKTYTVAALLAAELAGAPELRVALAAPTGKAASRLREALVATAERGAATAAIDAAVAARLATLPATTIHRLLGPRPDHRTRFRHDRDNPLELDLLVVDETSMLALPLAARLLDAVPDDCRLVLVGDPDQLSSIEVGALLTDLVRAAEPGGALEGRAVRLVRQHRTGVGSPIGPLAEAVRRGDVDAVLDRLRDSDDDRLRFVEVADGDLGPSAVEAVIGAVAPAYAAARSAALAGERSAAFEAAGAGRILCAHRRGPFGVAAWNDLVEQRVAGIEATAGGARRAVAGRVLLATRNDPRTGLVNGDYGVLVGEGSAARAVFRRSGELVAFDPAELDAVETAYALTVHKSQGSEYGTVAVVHPPADSPLVSRELLYTAVTRCRSRLVLVASVAAIRRAVVTPTRRVTGLAATLGADDR